MASLGLVIGLLAFLGGFALIGMRLGYLPAPAATGPSSTPIDMSVVAPPAPPDLYGWQITRYAGRGDVVPDGPVNGIAFTIRIPALNYNSVVRVGTDTQILDQGPGWYPDSGWPGQPGNVGVAGHNTFWLSFSRLKPGDEVVVTTQKGTYTYAINGSKVVEPDDKTVLLRTADPQLTLTTCYPLWAGAWATQRLIFTSRQVGAP